MAVQEFTTQELQTEEWRDIVGYEGIYSVSSLGRIRGEKAVKGYKAGRIHRHRIIGGGYLAANLYIDGQSKNKRVHKLVATAFIGECTNGLQVNHKDGNKHNNRIENLEYVTRSENMLHAHRTGLTNPARGNKNGIRLHPESRARGDRNGKTKIADSDIPRIFELREKGLSQDAIGAIFSVSGRHISSILRGMVRCRR